VKPSSRKIEDLSEVMQDKVHVVLNECQAQGVDLLVTSTFRSLEDQARLFRKTRTLFEISQKILVLRGLGFDFLADILGQVGPQAGKLGDHVTWVGPGESWHNYGLAVDAVVVRAGKLDWDPDNDPDWETYVRTVERFGLESAARWLKHREWPHAQQKGLDSNPLAGLTPAAVRALLEKIGAM
jgi:peptidoglycan L-alanyl-D-glutamate endopeptidase CwlK